MNGLTQWLTVVGLSATPALVLGQSAAAAAGIGFGLDPYVLCAVMALASFAEGMVVAWLANKTTKIKRVEKWCARLRTPKAVRIAERWGPWGGLMLGVAAVGQEPILIGLRWLGVGMKRLVLPTLLSNILYSIIYYWVVRAGWELI